MRAEVLVVGAGPAGSATARHLALAGHEVLLVERTRFERERAGESLAPAVQPLLRDLGSWESFLSLEPTPSWGTRSVWGTGRPEAHSYLISPYASGWHVDRRAVDELLARDAAGAGAELRTGTTVERVGHDGRCWQVRLSSGAEIEAAALVDATGRSARLARRLGAKRHVFDRLVAVSARLSGTPDEQHLLVESAPAGWWYSAPLPAGGMVVMLMTDSDVCRDLDLARPGRWKAALETTVQTRARLGAGWSDARPQVRPATSIRIERTDDLPWLAVGDAALAVDPLSGSGVVRGLRNAAAAASALLAHRDGDGGALATYEHDRDAECTDYLTTRAAHYALEQRWSTPFWRRRRLDPA